MARGITFIPIPPEGFPEAEVEKMVHLGLTLWGVVPVQPRLDAGTLPELGAPAVKTVVLYQDPHTLPTNLVAHQLVLAHESKTGLAGVTQAFFGLTPRQLAESLDQARKQLNEPQEAPNDANKPA